MKILFLCRFLPHPRVRDSGGQDTYHYITALSERHSVSLIAFARQEQQGAVTYMRSLCEEVVAVPYQPYALLPRLWRQWWRLWLPRVYGRNVSFRYWKCVRSLLDSTQFDAVIVDGMMAYYGSLIQGTKRILDEIDIYSVVAYHIYYGKKRLLSRIWYKWDWIRTQISELHYVSSYDGVLVRSMADQRVLNSFVPIQSVKIVSPWFEGLDKLQSVPLERPKGNNLLFVGAMNLPANVEAVLYFTREILPLIRQQVPDVKFYIVGSTPTPEVQRLSAEEGVVLTGEVEDLTPYYVCCAVNVVPLLRGGGIIVKTLNGMAAGRPTVATPAGNAGIGAKVGRDLLVVDKSPASFSIAVIDLLLDYELWRTISENGKRYVVTNYHWRKTIRELEEFIENLDSTI